MSLSIKTPNYLRAEKLNRSEANRYQDRLHFLDWQYLMRCKHHEERMEKIRLTIELLNKSTGGVSGLENSPDQKARENLDRPTELYLGNRRFWLAGPAAVKGQSNLNRVRTPTIHSSRLSYEVSGHLGWGRPCMNGVTASDSLNNPVLAGDEPYDEFPITQSFSTAGDVKKRRADRHARTLNKIGLSLKENYYLANAYKSDIKILKCEQKTNYILDKMNSLQQKKIDRDLFREDLENAKNDPFYGLE